MLIELFLLVLIVAVIVWTIRSGKSLVVLENPVVVHRPGEYHITLAPQLGRAQSFLEQIAVRFASSPVPQGDLPSLYFEVRDPHVQDASYLLAIARRGGMLYFQAINPPRNTDCNLKTLREFSEAVLAQLPLKETADAAGAEHLCAAVDAAAHQLNISTGMLE